ncbi:MAG: DNA repair protein RecO [Chloroflexi bacterium RBG_13_56_8]|nr:MAG: DNA repair protein RecO [Chloroflexi bacterium RBG_13_56_8]
MQRERVYQTEALVIRSMDYAEADRILTLLTPGGKRRVIAKGIRRPTSRKAGHLGLFHRARVMLAKGRNLDIVTQAESLEEFEGLATDLLRFTYACYVGELLDRFAQEEEEIPSLYKLAVSTLRRLSTEEDLPIWVRYFELQLLRTAGYQPELFVCVECHEEIRPQSNYFDPEFGGLLCDRCGPVQPQAVAVSLNAQKVMRYLYRHSASEVGTLHVGSATHAEVESLLHAYLEHILERKVQSVDFLRRLRQELRQAQRQPNQH